MRTFTDVNVKIHNSTSGVCQWNTDTHHYFFWFEIKDGVRPSTDNLYRKLHTASKNAMSSVCNPRSGAQKQLVAAVVAFAHKNMLLTMALEEEADKKAEEQGRWKAKRREQVINKHGIGLYDNLALLLTLMPYDGDAMARAFKALKIYKASIDDELTKLDAQPITDGEE